MESKKTSRYLSAPLNRNLAIASLIVAALLESLLFVAIWKKSAPRAVLGFLSKSGPQYVLYWKDEENQTQLATYPDLTSAIHSVESDLGLAVAANPVANHEVENVWLNDRFGSYVLFWKRAYVGWINRITFQDKREALFFADAFKRGAYSPSPQGHAILLLPSQN